jgi:pimeloyl-ACP methyl ester carboxylesterase
MAKMTSQRNGVPISYDDLGKGEPALLFLPGWCMDRRVFQDLFPRCAMRHRTLAIDWRGHGESGPADADFGSDDLVVDARSVIEASGARKIVPVAMGQAGWIAIELCRRLPDRIERLVLIDWTVLRAPPPQFLEMLAGMRSRELWHQTVELTLSRWLAIDNPRLIRFVHETTGAHGFEMWARAAREIGAAYEREGSPLQALARLDPPLPTLHLVSQADDEASRSAENSFSASHPWYRSKKLGARSHFPMFEAPEETAAEIKDFCG